MAGVQQPPVGAKTFFKISSMTGVIDDVRFEAQTVRAIGSKVPTALKPVEVRAFVNCGGVDIEVDLPAGTDPHKVIGKTARVDVYLED